MKRTRRFEEGEQGIAYGRSVTATVSCNKAAAWAVLLALSERVTPSADGAGNAIG